VYRGNGKTKTQFHASAKAAEFRGLRSLELFRSPRSRGKKRREYYSYARQSAGRRPMHQLTGRGEKRARTQWGNISGGEPLQDASYRQARNVTITQHPYTRQRRGERTLKKMMLDRNSIRCQKRSSSKEGRGEMFIRWRIDFLKGGAYSKKKDKPLRKRAGPHGGRHKSLKCVL